MQRPACEVADIIHRFGARFEQAFNPPVQVRKTLQAIALCRTAQLGGHVARCSHCGKEQISYNSCRNRHCPKCQAVQKQRWILARESELLPVAYYHMVFTIPSAFNDLLPFHAKEVYASLFSAAWQTLQTLAGDPKYLGAQPAMTAILHTWGQQLWLHPHLHCIVPGGGLTQSGKWKHAAYRDQYLFPKRVMSVIFRAKFMAELRKRMPVDQSIARKAFATQWVVYAKRPFASPKTVVEYLGRYTHKIAISNHRLLEVNDQTVSFAYKDYRKQGIKKVATLGGVAFLRRFAAHILPAGFVRIRHYGFLASRNKTIRLNLAKKDLKEQEWKPVKYPWQDIARDKLNYNPGLCPCCKTESMQIVEIMLPKRAPPLRILHHE